MTDRPKTTEIEAVMRQVEQAIKEGSIDAELESNREVRQKVMEALIKAEHIDPEKLRRRINV